MGTRMLYVVYSMLPVCVWVSKWVLLSLLGNLISFVRLANRHIPAAKATPTVVGSAFQLCQLKIMYFNAEDFGYQQNPAAKARRHGYGCGCCGRGYRSRLPEGELGPAATGRWETPFTAIYRLVNLKSPLSHTLMQTCWGMCFCSDSSCFSPLAWRLRVLSSTALPCKTRIMPFYRKWKRKPASKKQTSQAARNMHTI